MNYKQEKRIKDAAHMVRNVKSMSENMLQINSNYASDLEQFIQKLKDIPTPGASASVVDSTIGKDSHEIILIADEAPRASSEAASDEDEEATSQSKKEGPKKTKRPPAPWVKGLYRKIMKKCHPDIIAGDLPPEEQIYRAEALHIAIESYKKEDFDDLVYAGALVGVFSERLSTNKIVVPSKEDLILLLSDHEMK